MIPGKFVVVASSFLRSLEWKWEIIDEILEDYGSSHIATLDTIPSGTPLPKSAEDTEPEKPAPKPSVCHFFLGHVVGTRVNLHIAF